MKDIISIKDATRHIDSGKPFTCTVVTYDASRGTGGKIIELEGVLARTVSDRPPTPYEQRDTDAKAQNHYDNYTRNIALTTDGQRTAMLRKIHPPLLLTFNNKTVVP